MIDDDAPPARQLTDEERAAHFDAYPPGTPPIESRLDVRLHRVERDNETLRREVASLTASRDTNRKVMWLVVPALVGSLATVLIFAAEKIESSSRHAGEADADVRNLIKQLDLQRSDIAEIRAFLYRKSGADPLSHPDSGIVDPDAWRDGFARIGDWGHSVPASSGGGGAGTIGTSLHHPPLQNRHTFPNCSHSELLEQRFRHPPRGLTSSGSGVLHEAMTMATTDTM